MGRRHVEPKRARRLQVDDRLELARLHLTKQPRSLKQF
jgi:hypothetical protein